MTERSNGRIDQRMTLRLPIRVSEMIFQQTVAERRSFTAQLLHTLERNLDQRDIVENVMATARLDDNEENTDHYIRFPTAIYQKLRQITDKSKLSLKQVVTALVLIDDQKRKGDQDEAVTHALVSRLPANVRQSLASEAKAESLTVLDKVAALIIQAYKAD